MKKAQWIWIHNSNLADEYTEFFDAINYSEGNVYINISCSCDYNLYINDKLIGFGQYADYPHYKVYDTIDLSSVLIKGNNLIKIICWHNGTLCSVSYNESPGLIYEIICNKKILAYSNTKTNCCISSNYISYKNKKITNQLGPTYFYDSRNNTYSKHFAVKRCDYYTKNLFKRPIKKLMLMPSCEAILIDSQKRIYDIGREVVGFLKIIFCAPKGSLITVGYGEHLDDGEVRRIINERDFSVNIIANGEKIEFLGSFRRLGCRYLQIYCNTEVSVDYIGIAETVYPLDKIYFNTSDSKRKNIYDTAVRTLELCMHEHYEDCPWREQSMYVMDSRNQMLCGYYAFKGYDFAKACLILISKAQKNDKLLPLCFPSIFDYPIPFFSLMFPVALNEYGEHSKDYNFLIENIALCEDIISFFTSKIENNGLVAEPDGYWNFYEWNEGLDGSNKVNEKRFALPLNCFLILTLENLEQICIKTKKQFKYGEYIPVLRQAVFRVFYDIQKEMFKSFSNSSHYSSLCNSLAVLTGCAFDKKSDVCEKIALKKGLIETTLSMKIFEYDALLYCDSDKYISFVLNEIDALYGYMLEKNASTFWETIKGADDFEGAGSLCHGWSALSVYYYRKLINN